MKARIAVPVAAVMIPFILYELLRNSPYDVYIHHPRGHFYIVSAIAIISTVLGIAIGLAGSRLRNIKVSFLSLAFVSLAGVFTLQGLTTPGVFQDDGQLPGAAAQLSIVLATFWLWLSSLSADHAIILYLARWKNSLVPVWSIVLAVGCALAVLYPEAAELVPFTQEPLRTILVFGIIMLNGLTIYSYYRAYRYSKFPLQIAIVYSAGWFIVAQVIIVTSEMWRFSWWLYLFLLLASMIAMVWGFMKQYGSNRSLVKAVQALYTTDPGERVTHNLSPSVRSLIAAVESKDSYTAGHNFRVTLYALRIAEEMGLSPEQLRALVTGTIVHDIGKIEVPNYILNKPGILTDEEKKIIEQHPVTGYEMCRNLGFMQEELSIIRSHHERVDGQGYPDGLEGSQIPLLARIVAVADVYDALTSKRAYRHAWSHEETIAYLRAHRGAHFDPECVDAWSRVCDRDSSAYQDVHNEMRLFSIPGTPS